MTRQPAEEKRITVACPMPRLAPVRSSVRRGVLLDEVGINGFSFSPSCPALCRASSLTFSRRRRKTWMAGTSPAMTPTLWIKPRLGPWLIRPRAAELDAVVQAGRAVGPEPELGRQNAPAAPARLPRDLSGAVAA